MIKSYRRSLDETILAKFKNETVRSEYKKITALKHIADNICD